MTDPLNPAAAREEAMRSAPVLPQDILDGALSVLTLGTAGLLMWGAERLIAQGKTDDEAIAAFGFCLGAARRDDDAPL